MVVEEEELFQGSLDLTSNDDDIEEDSLESIKALKEFLKNPKVAKKLQNGMSVREYSKEIKEELDMVVNESVIDYRKQADQLADLHKEIKFCDTTLNTMDDMLQQFQQSLGTISSDIKSLQDKSHTMNIKLKNRKETEYQLAKYIHNVVISPKLMQTIFDGEIDENYMDMVKTLDKKCTYTMTNTNDTHKATGQMKPKLYALSQKACSRIRVFLLEKMTLLTKPKTNTHLLKVNVLLKYKVFYRFLSKYAKVAGLEVRNTYIDTVGRYYYYSFRSYIQQLTNLERERSMEIETLIPQSKIQDSSQQQSLFQNLVTTNKKLTNFFGQSSLFHAQIEQGQERIEPFKLGDRMQITTELNVNVPIVCHIAEQKKDLFHYEAIYHSIMLLLVDSVTSEYVFCLDFFSERHLHELIFSRSQEVINRNINDYLESTQDLMGLLLLMHLNHHFRTLLKERRIGCLDDFYDGINIRIIGKLQELFQLHINSLDVALQQNDPSLLIDEFEQKSTIIENYTNLISSIHRITFEGVNQHLIDVNLEKLRTKMIEFIQRVAKQNKNELDKNFWLIKTYDKMIHAFMSYSIVCHDVHVFGTQLGNQVQKLIDYLMSKHFGYLKHFLVQYNPKIVKNDSEATKQNIPSDQLRELGQLFRSKYKSALEGMKANLEKQFSIQGGTGRDILEKLFLKVITIYSMYYKMVYACWNSPPFRSEILSVDRLKSDIQSLYK
mmetsp:Transcript_11713/g.17391  ORF Transcript_11713/g.17391 Transcript_11713/m.17391 type:complete len:720 (+) Transcript_11713:36-2195(+)